MSFNVRHSGTDNESDDVLSGVKRSITKGQSGIIQQVGGRGVLGILKKLKKREILLTIGKGRGHSTKDK